MIDAKEAKTFSKNINLKNDLLLTLESQIFQACNSGLFEVIYPITYFYEQFPNKDSFKKFWEIVNSELTRLGYWGYVFKKDFNYYLYLTWMERVNYEKKYFN